MWKMIKQSGGSCGGARSCWWALWLWPLSGVQYGSQLIVNPEIRDPNYDMLHLFAMWYGATLRCFSPSPW